MSEDLIESLKKIKGVRTYTDEDGKFHMTTVSEEKEKIKKEQIERLKEVKANRMKCIYSEVPCDECEYNNECLVYQEVESLGYEIENLQEEYE